METENLRYGIFAVVIVAALVYFLTIFINVDVPVGYVGTSSPINNEPSSKPIDEEEGTEKVEAKDNNDTNESFYLPSPEEGYYEEYSLLNDTQNDTNTSDPENGSVVEVGSGIEVVTYYFFTSPYCATCVTMEPWIAEVGAEHPSLNVRLIDVRTSSHYIKKYKVVNTATSVVVKAVNGVEVSGTKAIGYMTKEGIEFFICTELQDSLCVQRFGDQINIE